MPPTDLDLTIVQVNAPDNVQQGTTLSLTVDVQATQDAFDEGAAFNLFVYVDGLKAGPLPGTPLTISGSLQTSTTWSTPSATIPCSITAGSAPDVYIVTASLLGGPKGAVYQAQPVCAANKVVVHP